jgi:hypothetical protein
MSVVFRLHSSALIRAEDLRQLSMPLGHRDILERVPPFQRLVEEEEAESSYVLLYRACIELLVLEQVCLVLAQVLRSELVGWLVEVLGEVLHDSQVAFYGTLGIITTLSCRASRPAKPHENGAMIAAVRSWRGPELTGEVEAVTLSDPERACLSE